MGDWAYRILALMVLGCIIFYALRTYHHRELARIETAELELEDFLKLKLAAITFAWQCPHCGTPLLTSEALLVHRTLDSSACAEKVERAARAAELAAAQAAGMRAEQVTPEDSWPALGQEEEPAGLES
jgi:hypothetical protein